MLKGQWKGANQALTYIIFKRDIALFREKYPELEIIYHTPLGNYIRYIVSGGLNFKPLLPYWLKYLVKLFEYFLYPFKRYFALHHIIVLRKK